MKKEDTPQQAHEIYEGEKKAVYVVNEEGKMEMAQTAGWEAEIIVLQQAIDDINRLADDALKRVKSGESSPLEYHMYAQRMDIPMLAQAVGCFQWQLKRHLKPKGFAKLSEKKLGLYAKVLGISTEVLSNIPN